MYHEFDKPHFTFFSDPGHGWLFVDLPSLKKIGMGPSDFTGCSYHAPHTFTGMYLEEDCDAPLFMKAYKEKMGEELLSEYVYHDGRSNIRYYSQRMPEDILE